MFVQDMKNVIITLSDIVLVTGFPQGDHRM
jgi:hypothetical protein